MSVPYAEVIGDPIAHSKSPLIHKFWLNRLGRSGDYRAVRLQPSDLPDYFATRRSDPYWRGCNVTMPLKREVFPFLAGISSEAERLGAVNCIVPRSRAGGLFGTNFDGDAVLHCGTDIVGLGPSWSAVVIGTGGAARAGAWAAALLCSKVFVMGRDSRRAGELVRDLGLSGPLEWSEPPSCELLINATPLGMKGYPPLPFTLERLPSYAVVFDMVYDPLETPLLKCARERGLALIDGLAMLIEQAAMSFVSFFNRSPDEALRREVRELLTR